MQWDVHPPGPLDEMLQNMHGPKPWQQSRNSGGDPLSRQLHLRTIVQNNRRLAAASVSCYDPCNKPHALAVTTPCLDIIRTAHFAVYGYTAHVHHY